MPSVKYVHFNIYEDKLIILFNLNITKVMRRKYLIKRSTMYDSSEKQSLCRHFYFHNIFSTVKKVHFV